MDTLTHRAGPLTLVVRLDDTGIAWATWVLGERWEVVLRVRAGAALLDRCRARLPRYLGVQPTPPLLPAAHRSLCRALVVGLETRCRLGQHKAGDLHEPKVRAEQAHRRRRSSLCGLIRAAVRSHHDSASTGVSQVVRSATFAPRHRTSPTQ